jgi:hypothetical protein
MPLEQRRSEIVRKEPVLMSLHPRTLAARFSILYLALGLSAIGIGREAPRYLLRKMGAASR